MVQFEKIIQHDFHFYLSFRFCFFVHFSKTEQRNLLKCLLFNCFWDRPNNQFMELLKNEFNDNSLAFVVCLYMRMKQY